MSRELTEKAAKILLEGGTLLSEKCPYCSGVRVIKDGNALCVSCGREPEEREIKQERSSLEETLERKMQALSAELEGETDHEKQQQILKSINSLLDTMRKAGQ
ncbi:MAG: hypothetical protein EB829_02370 [Nitrosopumilus sp. H8]|nr:MAG: hypothetical protein EB829_02370 [Nitrosopumilus sp. H8]